MSSIKCSDTYSHVLFRSVPSEQLLPPWTIEKPLGPSFCPAQVQCLGRGLGLKRSTADNIWRCKITKSGKNFVQKIRELKKRPVVLHPKPAQRLFTRQHRYSILSKRIQKSMVLKFVAIVLIEYDWVTNCFLNHEQPETKETKETKPNTTNEYQWHNWHNQWLIFQPDIAWPARPARLTDARPSLWQY